MKVSKFLVAALVVVGLSSMASAVNQVWFQAVPAEGSAGIVSQGPGQVANLSCLGGRCSWDVSMMLQSDESLSGWSQDIIGPQLPTPDKLRVKSFTYPPTPPNPFSAHDTPQIGLSPNLVLGAGSLTAVGQVAPPGLHEIFRFRLSKNMAPNNPFPTQVIQTRVGDFEWSNAAGNYPLISFAGGPAVPGAATGDLFPIIIIQKIPEPATLGLLSLGLLGLIRRRRVAR